MKLVKGMRMKLFLLKRKTEPDYDEFGGFVLRADSSKIARYTAASKSGDEGANTWLDEGLTSCEELTSDGEPGIILRDFNAG